MRTGLLVTGISYMCTLWRGQELAACFRTGSSSQSVAGVGFSVRKRALLIYISTAAPTLWHPLRSDQVWLFVWV